MFERSILKKIILSSNILVVISWLIALLGSYLSPDRFVLPAYFTLIAPVILIANIVFILLWILSGKWWFLLSLSVLIISTSQVFSIFSFHFEKTNPPADRKISSSINILTYNTMMSGKLKKNNRANPNLVYQYVLKKNADIVCLQEFTVSLKKEYLTEEDIMKLFKAYPYKHICYSRIRATRMTGVATFSKYPIINKQRIDYPSKANVSIYSDIDVNGKIIRLINNHLESNRITEDEKDIPEKLIDNFDTDSLTGMTLQFSRKLAIAYKIRAKQANAVADEILKSPYGLIVCGDFNDVPMSYAYSKVKGNLKDAYNELHSGFGWTFRKDFYGFRIDYLFYNEKLFNPTKVLVDKVNYSDHYPLICNININNT